MSFGKHYPCPFLFPEINLIFIDGCQNINYRKGSSNMSHSGAIYHFIPVQVECSENGRTRWRECSEGESNSRLFTLRDVAAYPQAMTRAMQTILRALEE